MLAVFLSLMYSILNLTDETDSVPEPKLATLLMPKFTFAHYEAVASTS
jgi:hypothetical protein